jgi:hypothetical protein
MKRKALQKGMLEYNGTGCFSEIVHDCKEL